MAYGDFLWCPISYKSCHMAWPHQGQEITPILCLPCSYADRPHHNLKGCFCLSCCCQNSQPNCGSDVSLMLTLVGYMNTLRAWAACTCCLAAAMAVSSCLSHSHPAFLFTKRYKNLSYQMWGKCLQYSNNSIKSCNWFVVAVVGKAWISSMVALGCFLCYLTRLIPRV